MDHIYQTGEKTQFLPPEKHPPYPWHILAIQNVQHWANLPRMFTLLRQHRLHWLGHVYCMEDGRIPKDILYGELASGRRSKGRPQLRYKDVCKRDMKALDINTESSEDLAAYRMMWRSTLNQHLEKGEKKLVNAEVGKRACRKERNNSNIPETTNKCDLCGRDCFSRMYSRWSNLIDGGHICVYEYIQWINCPGLIQRGCVWMHTINQINSPGLIQCGCLWIYTINQQSKSYSAWLCMNTFNKSDQQSRSHPVWLFMNTYNKSTVLVLFGVALYEYIQ